MTESNMTGLVGRPPLDEQRERFIAEVVRGAPYDMAAVIAGYSEDTGRKLIRHPAIVAAIGAEVGRILRTDGAPLGLRVLVEVAKNAQAPAGVRVDAAKTLLARAGHVEPRVEPKKADSRDLSEMTADELRSVIDDCEKRLSDQATPVGAPLAKPADAQDIDMFE